MSRYLIFAGDRYEPGMGPEHLVAEFGNIHEAIGFVTLDLNRGEKTPEAVAMVVVDSGPQSRTCWWVRNPNSYKLELEGWQ